MVAIENTCNRGGGSCYDFEVLRDIQQVCRQHNLIYHLDGARLFNALAETSESTLQYGRLFDSISVCLSKGLGAPVGSVLLGNEDFITEARRFRKAFGGGMRQAGFMAAAGTHALENHISRLKEDHIRAGELEKVLLSMRYVETVLPVETNIVIFTLKGSMERDDLLNRLKEAGILMSGFGPQMIRAVFHLDIHDADLETLKKALESIDSSIKH